MKKSQSFTIKTYPKSPLELMPTGKLKLAWRGQTMELLLKILTKKNKNIWLLKFSIKLTTKVMHL